VLRIVTDFNSDEVREPRIESDIEALAAKINAAKGGGIRRKRGLW